MTNTDTQTADRLDTEAVPSSKPPTEISRIDDKYQPSRLADTEVDPGQGVLFRKLPELIEAAKLMARADIAVPPHCRDQPSVCFAILMRTNNWKLMDPFFVAEHSYVVSKKVKGDDGTWGAVKTLAFDSAVFQAALLASGAIRGRPQYEYHGEGAEMTCTVSVQLHDGGWEEHTSPPMKVVHPGHSQTTAGTFVKGSPLWDKNPTQQLGYFTLRDLVRLKFQDVLGGIYDPDEYEETPVGPTASSPNLLERLPGHMEDGTGFQTDVVDQGLAVPSKAKAATRKAATKRQGARAARGKGKQSKPQRQGSPKPTGRAPKPGPKPKAAQAPAAAPARAAPAAAQPATKAPQGKPTNAAEYVAQARIWIAQATSVVEAGQRWEAERDLRERLQVPIATRTELQAAIKAMGG